MNQTFDINRSIALLKLNFHLNKKTMLLTLAGFFGFVFITSFFVANNAAPLLNKMHLIFYFIFLYGGVALIAGSSFRHINRSDKAIAYLSLPASTFEKYIVPWLLSGIIWGIVSIAAYLAFAIVINGLWSGVMGFSFEMFNPFTVLMGQQSVHEPYMPYFLVHAIFFLGAAAFKKNAIPKTLLTGFIINSTFTFIGLFTMLILFGKFGTMDTTMMNLMDWDPGYKHFFTEVLPQLIKNIFVYLLPVIFYVAAFFKLREREV